MIGPIIIAAALVADSTTTRDRRYDHLVELYFDEDTERWETTNKTRSWDLRGDARRVLGWASENLPARPQGRWTGALLGLRGQDIELIRIETGNRSPLYDVLGPERYRALVGTSLADHE